jgi:hypothetical protein
MATKWTKESELYYLDQCIQHLTVERSYLGPAIKSMRGYIESCMKSDYFPDLAGEVKEMEVQKKYLHADIAKASTELSEAQKQLRIINSEIDFATGKLGAAKRVASEYATMFAGIAKVTLS